MIYGGLGAQSGIGQVTLNADGDYVASEITFANGQAYDDQITSLAQAQVNGVTYIFGASSTEHGISTWTVASNGDLSNTSNLGNDEGLWITAPTALETVTIGANTYLVLAAAGTGSLSVMRVENDGSLTITEHILDTRDTRFGGVSDIEIITYHGQTYVIAGGSDGGLSVFVMLPSGQLVARAHIADTPDMSLANISTIAAHGQGNGINIFVASSAETGISQLRFDTGPVGTTQTANATGDTLTGAGGTDLIIGGAGNDILTGGVGDDIIQDGRGSGTLTGGSGADIFTLIFNGETDTITDFQVGIDQIGLSGWPMVRDRSQLTMTITDFGMTISYGDKLLIVRSSDGQLIDHRFMDTADLIAITRIPQIILPGYAGPIIPDPNLPGGYIPPATETESSGTNSTIIIGNQTFQTTQARAVNGLTISGENQNNRIDGGSRHDRLSGKDGDGFLVGNNGDDRLYGGWGKATIPFMAAMATTPWSAGKDQDTLSGGAGDDLLTGGTHPDTFISPAETT